MSRPERVPLLAVTLAAVAISSGCGKSNLLAGATRGSPPPTAALSSPRAPRPETAGRDALAPVAIPLKLTAARASAFARAVNLLPVDIPGSHIAPRSPTVESQREEAAGECSHAKELPIGGGRSAKLDRGGELEAESISSSVVVMSSVQAARADLAYADSQAGLACYTALLRRKLDGESSSSVRVGRVVVKPLTIGSGSGLKASGLRIAAEISGVKSGLVVGLFVDALGFAYGPAEIQLYATSFVQPLATRTEDDLLALMQARARLSRL